MSRILMKPPKRVLRIYRDDLLDFVRQVRDFGKLSSRLEKVARDTRAIFEISKGSIPRDNLGRYFSGLIPLWHDKNVISIDHRHPFPSVLPRSLSRS